MAAGAIDRDWYKLALQNRTHEELEALFSEITYSEYKITTKDLNVWCIYSGRCWAQNRIDEICKKILKRTNTMSNRFILAPPSHYDFKHPPQTRPTLYIHTYKKVYGSLIFDGLMIDKSGRIV